ncbi:MAG: D-xylose transporter substrate-binding protein [Actinomycetota bacterium]
MKKRRYLAILAAMAFALTACGGAAEEPAAEAPAEEPAAEEPAAEGVVVGVSWNNFQEERWGLWDEPALKGAIEAAGGTYISTDAASSAEQQLADVENLISQGAQALVILAQDGTAILPAVESAISQGIPVIAYDRLIENPDVLYITFDNVEVGRMQAAAVFAEVPEGKYVFIKGNAADANSDFLRGGQGEVLQEAIDSGAIEIVGEEYTDNWDPAVAQTNMEQILTANGNDVDAVVASNDGTAGGVIAALAAQGLAGQVPVSGQDGDGAALNRVALGTQTVSVWKDARELGAAAGAAAVRLAAGESAADVAGGFTFDTPGGNTLATILLKPIPVTRDNLNLVVDAGWITVENLCQDVEAGSVDVCP